MSAPSPSNNAAFANYGYSPQVQQTFRQSGPPGFANTPAASGSTPLTHEAQQAQWHAQWQQYYAQQAAMQQQQQSVTVQQQPQQQQKQMAGLLQAQLPPQQAAFQAQGVGAFNPQQAQMLQQNMLAAHQGQFNFQQMQPGLVGMQQQQQGQMHPQQAQQMFSQGQGGRQGGLMNKRQKTGQAGTSGQPQQQQPFSQMNRGGMHANSKGLNASNNASNSFIGPVPPMPQAGPAQMQHALPNKPQGAMGMGMRGGLSPQGGSLRGNGLMRGGMSPIAGGMGRGASRATSGAGLGLAGAPSGPSGRGANGQLMNNNMIMNSGRMMQANQQPIGRGAPGAPSGPSGSGRPPNAPKGPLGSGNSNHNHHTQGSNSPIAHAPSGPSNPGPGKAAQSMLHGVVPPAGPAATTAGGGGSRGQAGKAARQQQGALPSQRGNRTAQLPQSALFGARGNLGVGGGLNGSAAATVNGGPGSSAGSISSAQSHEAKKMHSDFKIAGIKIDSIGWEWSLLEEIEGEARRLAEEKEAQEQAQSAAAAAVEEGAEMQAEADAEPKAEEAETSPDVAGAKPDSKADNAETTVHGMSQNVAKKEEETSTTCNSLEADNANTLADHEMKPKPEEVKTEEDAETLVAVPAAPKGPRGAKRNADGNVKADAEFRAESSKLRLQFAVPQGGGPPGAPTGPKKQARVNGESGTVTAAKATKDKGLEDGAGEDTAEDATTDGDVEGADGTWTPWSRGPPQIASNRIVITYARGVNRLSIDVDSIKKATVHKAERTIEIVVSVQLGTQATAALDESSVVRSKGADRVEQEWVVCKGLQVEKREGGSDKGIYQAVPRIALHRAWDGEMASFGREPGNALPAEGVDHTLPPLFRLLPETSGEPPTVGEELRILVQLDRLQPLPNEPWLRTGNIKTLLAKMQSYSKRPQEHPWFGKLEVADPDPPPGLKDHLMEWANLHNKTTSGSPKDRRRFVNEHLHGYKVLVELFVKAIRIDGGGHFGNSGNLSSDFGQSLDNARSRWMNFGSSDRLGLALFAFFDIASGEREIDEAEAARLAAGLESILLDLPIHLLQKGADSLWKEYSERKRREEKQKEREAKRKEKEEKAASERIESETQKKPEVEQEHGERDEVSDSTNGAGPGARKAMKRKAEDLDLDEAPENSVGTPADVGVPLQAEAPVQTEDSAEGGETPAPEGQEQRPVERGSRTPEPPIAPLPLITEDEACQDGENFAAAGNPGDALMANPQQTHAHDGREDGNREVVGAKTMPDADEAAE
ncbi:hypothetical protein K437DRAFT_295035 [Tilletiaria anomala UBC 951]|uniref:Uncharacterized protein n=1 Tax=Tilletiaria anomala (strain ATCC 24038 / CBS 436.72 / UBC 951) TaxID=1037660 RepID=A0A066VPU4_TILAU|nr:uncharacterized protein K437DRAFT_295035 [Tilletiaria anomala UBC 951]KDN43762.1 hypothetical protein K437DRAFT_295035 [Tilletiaria anomala UBC 951]